VFATFATRFATSWSDRWCFPDLNRVTRKVSDATTQIGRPGASSSEFRNINTLVK
jgi:hypothetical protein